MSRKIRIAIVAALILAVWAACGWVAWRAIMAPEPPRRVTVQMTDREKAAFLKRLRYHGLQYTPATVITDHETGQAYFWRDGKKCRF